LRKNLQDDYADKITQLKNDLVGQRENQRKYIRSRFEEKWQADDNLLKSKKEIELDKIKNTEKSRVELEKLKIDNQIAENQNSAINFEKDLEKYKQELSQKLNTLSNNLIEQQNDEIENYKLELNNEKKSQISQINEKIEKEISAARTRINVEANQKSIDLINEKEQREKLLREKYLKSKEDLEKEYTKKMQNMPSFEESGTKKSHELKNKANLNKLRDELKTELSFYNSSLRKEEQDFEAKLNENHNTMKKECDKNAEQKLAKINEEISDFNSQAVDNQEITQEIGKVKKEAEFMDGFMEQKNSELELMQKHTKSLQKELDSLAKNLKDLQEKSEILEKDENLDSEIENLHKENREKDNEIKKLHSALEQKEADFMKAIVTISEAEPNEDLQRLAQDVKEIKQIVLESKKRPKTAERRRTQKPLESKRVDLTVNESMDYRELRHKNAKKAEKTQKEHDLEIKHAEAKAKEIELFITNEKTELQNIKITSAADYEVLSKLLKTLEKSRREWRQELNRSIANAPRKTVLESVKEKIDGQALMLTKQVDSVKKLMLQNEKKLSVLRMLESKLKICQQAKNTPEFVDLIQSLQKEYEAYMKKYKYATDLENQDILQNMPSEANLDNENDPVLDDMVNLLSPRLEKYEEINPTILAPINVVPTKRRNKSMHNVYKNVANYQDVLKKMNQRDIAKLAHGKANNTEIFKDEANWLYQMKTEVARTSYGFSKKF